MAPGKYNLNIDSYVELTGLSHDQIASLCMVVLLNASTAAVRQAEGTQITRATLYANIADSLRDQEWAETFNALVTLHDLQTFVMLEMANLLDLSIDEDPPTE